MRAVTGDRDEAAVRDLYSELLRAWNARDAAAFAALFADDGAMIGSLVARCEDDERWRIVLLQTTPAQYHGRPELVAAHTAEIQQVADAQRPA